MYASMMRKVSLFLFFIVAALSLGACTDTQPPPTAENNTGVSAIPWDKPEKWENGSNIPGAEYMNSR